MSRWLLLVLALAACRTPPNTAPPNTAPPASVGKPAPEVKPAREGQPVRVWRRPPVIDFHGHLSLDGADRLADVMADNGIEAMVNLSGGPHRRSLQPWREARALSDRFGGRIYTFANPDWRSFGVPGWGEREAEHLREGVEQHAIRGLKIAKILGLGAIDPDGQLVAVDDARLGPLWEACADLGIPVAIHVADPRAFWQPLVPQNERWDELKSHPFWAYGWIPPELRSQMPPRPPVPSWQALLQAAERLYRQHPRTIFVAVHFGNAAEDMDYVDGLLARNPNVCIDVAARLGEFGRHPPAKLRAFFERWQDRIVFGTDIGVGSDYLMLGANGEVEPQMPDVKPFYDAHWRFFETTDRQIAHPSPIQGHWRIDAIGLPPPVLDKLYRGNALRLLDRAKLKAFAAQAKPASPLEVPAPAEATSLAMEATPRVDER
jgi:predicted TIM-barrel fold metal-dependent hydrolase